MHMFAHGDVVYVCVCCYTVLNIGWNLHGNHEGRVDEQQPVQDHDRCSSSEHRHDDYIYLYFAQ